MFAGFNLAGDLDSKFSMDQNWYLKYLEELFTTASYREFRSIRMKIAWIIKSRPYCLYSINQLAQVTEKVFTDKPKELIKFLNNAVLYAIRNPCELKFPKLDIESLTCLDILMHPSPTMLTCSPSSATLSHCAMANIMKFLSRLSLTRPAGS